MGLCSWTEETIGFILQYVPYYDYIKIAFFCWCSFEGGAFQLYNFYHKQIDQLVQAFSSEYKYIITKKINVQADAPAVVEESKYEVAPRISEEIVKALDEKTDSKGSVEAEEQRQEPIVLDEVNVELPEESKDQPEDKPKTEEPQQDPEIEAEGEDSDDLFSSKNLDRDMESRDTSIYQSEHSIKRSKSLREEINKPVEQGEALATFGAGCFWCIEGVFARLNGVSLVKSGYAGGESKNPKYEDIKTNGHTEVIQVHFDQQTISFQQLVKIFFTVHDPTTLNRQGNDKGFQYRSVIFYQDEG